MDQVDDILNIELLSSKNDNQEHYQSLEKDQTNGSLRKQCKRLQQNRKILKEKNAKKATQIKALNGKTDDLQVSRDRWKNQCKESESKIIFLSESIRKMEVELNKEMEKTRTLEELFNAERQLRLNTEKARDSQIEELKKKLKNKRGSSQIPNQD